MKLQQINKPHPSLPIVVQLIDKAGECALRVLIAQCEVLVVVHVLYVSQECLQRNLVLNVISYDLLTVLHAIIAIPAHPAPAALSPKRKMMLQCLQTTAVPSLSGLSQQAHMLEQMLTYKQPILACVRPEQTK